MKNKKTPAPLEPIVRVGEIYIKAGLEHFRLLKLACGGDAPLPADSNAHFLVELQEQGLVQIGATATEKGQRVVAALEDLESLLQNGATQTQLDHDAERSRLEAMRQLCETLEGRVEVERDHATQFAEQLNKMERHLAAVRREIGDEKWRKIVDAADNDPDRETDIPF